MNLSQFIQTFAERHGHEVHNGPIDIVIQYTRTRYDESHLLFPGCVYGIAVELPDKDKKLSLFNAVCLSRQSNIANIRDWKPIIDGENIYPIYWGKEWASGNRLFFHLNGSSGNSSLCLYEQNYAQIEGLKIFYAKPSGVSAFRGQSEEREEGAVRSGAACAADGQYPGRRPRAAG